MRYVWGWTKSHIPWDRGILWLSTRYMEVGLCHARIPEQEENNIEIVIQAIQKYKLGLKRKTISSEPAACECTSSAISNYTLSLCSNTRRWEPKVVNMQSVIFDTLLLAAEQKAVSNSTINKRINNQPMQNGKTFPIHWSPMPLTEEKAKRCNSSEHYLAPWHWLVKKSSIDRSNK